MKTAIKPKVVLTPSEKSKLDKFMMMAKMATNPAEVKLFRLQINNILEKGKRRYEEKYY
jgi:hypothetical protein